MVKHRIKDSAIAGSNPAPTLRGVCVLNKRYEQQYLREPMKGYLWHNLGIAGEEPAPVKKCILKSWPMKATGLWAMYNSTGNQIDTDSKRYHI